MTPGNWELPQGRAAERTAGSHQRALRLSPRTEQAYVHYVSDFIAWTKWKTPETLTSADVTEYLSMLTVERNVAASTQNVAQAALNFMLKHNRKSFKASAHLITAREMKRILDAMPAKYIAMLQTSAGLRALRMAARGSRSMHHNAPIYALARVAEKQIGRAINPSGFFNSKILLEIAGGLKWAEAEKKYGAHKVKTACADLVRQFPQVITENLK